MCLRRKKTERQSRRSRNARSRSESRRILVTQDEDFLTEATRRHRAGETFFGIVYTHQLYVTIGECVNDLEIIAKDSEPDEWIDRVEHLPL